MNEPVADFYYNELLISTNRTKVLVSFYNSVFYSNDYSPRAYGRLGKLEKIFGAQIVFESILDSSSASTDRDIFPLISYYCKKNFIKKHNSNAAVEFDLASIDEKLEELEKEGLRTINIEDL